MADDDKFFYTFEVRAKSVITVPAANEEEGHAKAQLAFIESIHQTFINSDLLHVSINAIGQTGGDEE